MDHAFVLAKTLKDDAISWATSFYILPIALQTKYY